MTQQLTRYQWLCHYPQALRPGRVAWTQLSRTQTWAVHTVTDLVLE